MKIRDFVDDALFAARGMMDSPTPVIALYRLGILVLIGLIGFITGWIVGG